MQSQIFWYGYYSRDIVMTMGRILTPGMVVFDVGANIGEISLYAARRVGSEGVCIALMHMRAVQMLNKSWII